MKLVAYHVKDAPPIRHFSTDELSDVVVLAGPNGVGKTRLLTHLLEAFRSPGAGNNRIVIEATCERERTTWGKTRLDAVVSSDASILRSFLQRKQKRSQLRSGVLNFDASRVLETIKPYKFSWSSFDDPWEEQVGWDHGFSTLASRFQDTVHALHRKLRSQKEKIAKHALELHKAGETSMPLDFQDPLLKFKEAFASLLPGKKLEELDEQTQALKFVTEGISLPITSLSSGEREVVTVVFDFLLRDPKDCIIVFDEPELHLHPELSYRLLRTLREVGERNQFIFSTHSPDIIAASIEQSVVFVSPQRGPEFNQAVPVREDDEMSRVLHLLGQSIGVISLGKKIVLIEGERNSLDKQTYGSIVGASHPEFVLVPTGGRESIASFAKALDLVLTKTIWGVEFFMLCDGDAAATTTLMTELERKSSGRLRRLPRYHLENYFLDEHMLAKVFASVGEPADSWLCSPEKIDARLRDIAKKFLSYAVALRVAHRVRLAAGNVDLMPSGCTGKDLAGLTALFEEKRASEDARFGGSIRKENVDKLLKEEFDLLTQIHGRETGDWKVHLPGRPILNTFASEARLELPRLKTKYLEVARTATPDPFAEIREVFEGFSSRPKDTPPVG